MTTYFTLAVALIVPFVSSLGGVPGRDDRTHIVFGYMQNTSTNGPIVSYRWHALTHVGYTWVAFREDGSFHPDSLKAFAKRSPELLPGGAAANNRVRVIAVLCNLSFKREIVDAVFTSAERRSRLVAETVKMVTDPVSGCDGVSLDVEPMNFTPATAKGYNVFLLELARALHGLSPRRELSMYIGAFYPERYTLATFRDSIDYILFSAYNFASADVVNDVGLIDGIYKGIDSWLNAGMPANKIVLAAALFGKQWEVPKPAWGIKGKSIRAIGMDYGNYLVSTRQPPLEAKPSGPRRSCVWVSDPADKAGNFVVSTFDDMTAHERKLRMALTWDGETRKGVSLGGVGFWSLLWLSQGLQPGSVDLNDPELKVNRTIRRTYSPPWTLWEELFSPQTRKTFRAETFESTRLDPMWQASKDGPDSVNVARSELSSVQVSAGAAPGSHRAASFNFALSGKGRVRIQYRALSDSRPPHPIDRNALLVLTPREAGLAVPIFVEDPLPNAKIRIVVIDAKNQLERGPAFPLDRKGWQEIRWNMAHPNTVQSCPTRDAGFKSGNGTLESTGERDIGFVGLEIESSGAVSGRIEVDSILYSLSRK